MASQTINGKAFEFSLIECFYDRLKSKTEVTIDKSNEYYKAQDCFQSITDKKLIKSFQSSSLKAFEFLVDLEPNILGCDDSNKLTLYLQKDSQGQKGDVRDLVFIRGDKWEVGISAKNNHKAVKHPRLSKKYNFGSVWFELENTKKYFDDIKGIFEIIEYKQNKDKTLKWKDEFPNIDVEVYEPILIAFKDELYRLHSKNSTQISSMFIKYLIGKEDFYKVINSRNKVEIQAFNINNTLGKKCRNTKPKHTLSKLKLPSKIINIDFKENTKTTLIVTLNQGWQISLRIHNASSKLERSLKLDVNLVSTPDSLFTHHTFI
tara:strand:+ start:1914 stop:2870 length:957 start_codon:yes stop_codon:yes gene_type:complete